MFHKRVQNPRSPWPQSRVHGNVSNVFVDHLYLEGAHARKVCFRVFIGSLKPTALVTSTNVSTLVCKGRGSEEEREENPWQPFPMLCHKDDSCVAGKFSWSHRVLYCEQHTSPSGLCSLNLLQWKDPGTSNMSWQIPLVVIKESGECIDGQPFGQTAWSQRQEDSFPGSLFLVLFFKIFFFFKISGNIMDI